MPIPRCPECNRLVKVLKYRFTKDKITSLHTGGYKCLICNKFFDTDMTPIVDKYNKTMIMRQIEQIGDLKGKIKELTNDNKEILEELKEWMSKK